MLPVVAKDEDTGAKLFPQLLEKNVELQFRIISILL